MRSEDGFSRVVGALHRCKICGALWKLNEATKEQPEGSWSLVSDRAGKCCDNVFMGAQIVPLVRKPLVYIGGPFRAPTPWGVELNVREAEAAVAAMIEASGGSVVPVAPHLLFRHFDKLAPDAFFLEATLEILRKCDALYLLPGWERSSGTRGELAEAQRAGMIVSEYMSDVLARLHAASVKLDGASDG